MNMLECHTASSAEHIFNNIDTKLVANDIPWQMVSTIGVDNTDENI